MSEKEAHTPTSKKLTRRPLRLEHKQFEESNEESQASVDSSVDVEEEEIRHITHDKSKEKNVDKSKQTIYQRRNNKLLDTKKKQETDKYPDKLKHFEVKYRYIVGLVLFCCALFYRYSVSDISQGQSEVKSLSELIEVMKNHFKKQHSMTYHILETELKKVFNVSFEPAAPAILTLLADRGAESTASQFAGYLAKALAPEKYISVNDSSYWQGDAENIKLKIDEEIQSRYLKDKLNVIIIDNLQKIPFEAAMIFHSFCDHENSPFKRAIFLFILPLNVVISEDATSKHIDTIAMRSLRNVWLKATDDQVDSLITRISGSIVNIK